MSVDVSPWSLRPPERATPWPPSLHPLMPAPALSLSLPASVVSPGSFSPLALRPTLPRLSCDSLYPVYITLCYCPDLPLLLLHIVVGVTVSLPRQTRGYHCRGPPHPVSPSRPGPVSQPLAFRPTLPRLWPSVASALHPARHRQSPEHSVTTDTHATPCCSTNTAPERN